MTQPNNENDIIHASLLRGALSIKVTDTDIRREELESIASALFPFIETDYILQISSSSDASVGKDAKLETYCCSKRYVDVRSLADELHSHAVGTVKYYEKKCNNGSGSGGNTTSLLKKGVGKLLSKPAEYAQYITNAAPSTSNLANDLDSVFSGMKSGGSDNDMIGSSKPMRRTSTLLNQGAPMFVRGVMCGVDKFYDEIFTEKRQFGGTKTNYDHVQKVAERRTTIINNAFSNFLSAIAGAGLIEIDKSQQTDMPEPLKELILSVEKFMLTDVVDEADEKAYVKDEPKDLDLSFAPITRRRRASVSMREDEAKELNSMKEALVMTEEVDKKCKHSGATEGSCAHAPKLKSVLPEEPMAFATTVAVGAVFFKLIQDSAVSVQLDMLALFGISCGLIGYQMAVWNIDSSVGSAVIESDRTDSSSDRDGVVEVSKTPPKPTAPKSRRGLVRENNSTALIHKSMRNIQNFITGGGVDSPAESKPIVAAPTLSKFPDGAAIGSHFNCWSNPTAKDFRVRGPNYLKDKKKVSSGEFLFPCRGCDIFLTDNAPLNIGRNASILGGKLRDVPTFVINYRLPWGVFISYHEIPKKFVPFLRKGNGYDDPAASGPLPSMTGMTPGERAVCNFFLSDSEEKDTLWKMVPMVVDGPWVVKRVVGGKPAIIGSKLPISYVYQPPQPEHNHADYFEADLDIVSSAAARNILAVVRSYTQILTIDLGFVVQGNKVEELPEQMMMGLRIHGLDPLTAEMLPHNDSIATDATIEGSESGYDTE